MQVIPLTSVDCYNQSGITGNINNIRLNLAYICPATFLVCGIFIPAITPVRKLHDYKRKLFRTIHKLVAP